MKNPSKNNILGDKKFKKKVPIGVEPYHLMNKEDFLDETSQILQISSQGIEFSTEKNYPKGTILRINIEVPDYWERKKKHVEYSMIENPSKMKILAKVVQTEENRRTKKKITLARTVNIDEIDEMVLNSFLQES